MKFNKILLVAAMTSVLAVSTSSCSEDYVKLNQNPSNVSKADPKGLMTQAILEFQPNDYLLWWYNVNYLTRWTQMTCPTGSFSESFTEMAENGGQGGQYIATLRYRNEIKAALDNSGEEQYRGYEAACTILTVYLGLFDSDVYGALPYTEACRYKTDGILVPKYDMVKDLYDTWLGELDNCITVLQNKDLDSNAAQDPAYQGDWSKWARLANSLKLKIAVRLLAQDKSRALAIAKAVAESPAGYIDNLDQDFRYSSLSQRNQGCTR